MEVALVLSSQKPGASDSCLSWFILSCRLATSKKPPQDHHTVPHIFQLFLCHSGCEDKEFKVWSLKFVVVIKSFDIPFNNNCLIMLSIIVVLSRVKKMIALLFIEKHQSLFSKIHSHQLYATLLLLQLFFLKE